GGRRLVREKGVDRGDGRRQAGQVEGDASDQSRPVGLRVEREPLCFEGRQDEAVHVGPRIAGHLGNLRADYREEGAVRFGTVRVPGGATADHGNARDAAGERAKTNGGLNDNLHARERLRGTCTVTGLPPYSKGSDRHLCTPGRTAHE